MFGKLFKRAVPKTPAAAEIVNKPLDALEPFLDMGAAAPLNMTLVNGSPRFWVSQLDEFDGRITANLGSGGYTIQAQYGTTAGGWADLPGAPTFTAYEQNLNATLATATKVHGKRDWAKGDMRFQYDTC